MASSSKIEAYASDFAEAASIDASFVKIAKIRKLPNGKYRVLSEKGKNLGTYDTKELAKKRLRQVEFFKHKNASDNSHDDASYSATMRELRKSYDEDAISKFQRQFKSTFDNALMNNEEHPEDTAMEAAMECISVDAHVSAFKKQASAINLGDPEFAGKYLADLLRFLLRRISSERRQKSINSLKRKVYYLNEYQIASKKTPSSASLGHAIGLLKTILLEHPPQYVRSVLNSVVRHL